MKILIFSPKIFELTDQLRTTEDANAIQFLRDCGILRSLDNPPICEVCGEDMHIARRLGLKTFVGFFERIFF